MAVLRVSIFQKDLTESLNASTLKSLSRLKSDFLLLPEYFYADSNIKDQQALLDTQERAKNWLLSLSKSYKGSVIGGTFVHDEGEGSRLGIPLVQNGEILDWYDKSKLDENEKKVASPNKNGEGIFILGGVRFAVSSYSDTSERAFWEKLSQDEIKLIFLLSNFENSTQQKKIKEQLLSIAEKHILNIVLCCGVGKNFQFTKTLKACSAVITPYGISWQISRAEEKQQVIKTVLLNHSSLLGQTS